MKNQLQLLSAILLLIILVGCSKEPTPIPTPIPTPTPKCTFLYSAWTSCSKDIQTRTYTSSPSGCAGTPPADSISRNCDSPLVIIGTQTWTTKNLDVPTYRNGDVIPQVMDYNAWGNLTTGAWCYSGNGTANGTTYGKLYNWFAVNDPRGLAPNGFHIPTDAEWTILGDYLGGEITAGKEMKSFSGWYYYYINGNVSSPINGNGTNRSGFKGLPGDYRYSNGDFFGNSPSTYCTKGFWWSSSEGSTSGVWCRYLSNNEDVLGRSSPNARSGFSIRCIKD